MATRLWLKAALATGAVAWFAGDTPAQGRPGGGMGQGGGRCGGTSQLSSGQGMTAMLRGSPNAGAVSQLQGTNPAMLSQQALMSLTQAQFQGANSAALAQQLLAQQALINQLQAQLQAARMQGSSRQTGPQQTARLQTTPQQSVGRSVVVSQGATRAEEWSPVWSSVAADLTPTGTVTPADAAVPLAVSPSILSAYRIASGLKDQALARGYVDAGDVVLTTEPLPVSVETRFRGLAYVRPTEGRYAGKFLVVDAWSVK